jgi:hypothetical protein
MTAPSGGRHDSDSSSNRAAVPPLVRLRQATTHRRRSLKMNSIIYIVGLVVIVLAILGFLGLR